MHLTTSPKSRPTARRRRADVVEHRPRLGLDAARDGAVGTGRVTDLAREEDQTVRLDHLREWEAPGSMPGRFGTVLGTSDSSRLTGW